MTAVDLMKLELARLHKSYDKVLDELTPEQLHRVPAGHPKANTIAWGVWHYVRTEDNVVRYILQNRRPIVWAEGGYADKLGLPYILARLDDLFQKHGKRFLATAALRKLAESDGKFYR